MARPPSIQVKALAVLRHEHRLFVFRFHDVTRGDFYRPVGGTVEFGETALEAVHREVREELGADLDDVRLWEVIENRFEFEGSPGHEIVFLYSARFRDPRFYEPRTFALTETNGIVYEASWMDVADFVSDRRRLVPEWLLEALASSGAS